MRRWTTPVISQDPRTCWQACARMMWNYRAGVPDKHGFDAKAGSLAQSKQGLSVDATDAFYKQLGMVSGPDPATTGALRAQLKKGPAIALLGGQGDSILHVVVVVDYDARAKVYYQIDPAGQVTLTFEAPLVFGSRAPKGGAAVATSEQDRAVANKHRPAKEFDAEFDRYFWAWP